MRTDDTFISEHIWSDNELVKEEAYQIIKKNKQTLNANKDATNDDYQYGQYMVWRIKFSNKFWTPRMMTAPSSSMDDGWAYQIFEQILTIELKKHDRIFVML